MIIFFGIMTLFHFVLMIFNAFKEQYIPMIYNGFIMIIAFVAMSYCSLEALIGG